MKTKDDSKIKQKEVSNLIDIPLSLLDEFPNHPFKVRDDEDMLKLIESVSERGVLVPAIVRPKADGRYELLSGHRRKRASEYAVSSLIILLNTIFVNKEISVNIFLFNSDMLSNQLLKLKEGLIT